MSGSSSTTSNTGLLFTNASYEGLLEAGFAVAPAQLGRGAAKAHAAFLDDGDGGAQLLHVGEDMRGEEQGPALGREPAEHRFHRDPGGGVKAAHRLVEHVQVALQQERRGEAELLRHAL